MSSIQNQRLAIIQRVYREWADEQAGHVEPDPRYAHAGPSQYAEGIEALSADASSVADLHRRTSDALAAAGLSGRAVSD